MRFACDTGGTFTDLIVEDERQSLHLFKAATTYDDPVAGVLDSLEAAARNLRMTRSELLGKGKLFIHGTTRAINAIITGKTARTALLTTRGHKDILVFREGGRIEPFNFDVEYPDPYVPRALTFEVDGRIDAEGNVVEQLDEEAVRKLAGELRDRQVEAVAVCLLWSVANPVHEARVGEILEEELPDVPVTLSHEVNPILREYRRASAASIDASLKPLMQRYMESLEGRLRSEGFRGRLLIVTSQGGMIDAAALAAEPIHAINSGPAMAPIAGRHYARSDARSSMAIVADTGGTTYDVSLIRDGQIPWTNETWIGQPFRGHMTGFPSIDVRSIGAGGGSIAWVDSGGMLHVGPQSAGAVPGPVCYGAGGTSPTLSDAALICGYLHPDTFLGGSIKLAIDPAKEAIRREVAGPLGLNEEQAALAVIQVATENMVRAIEDITVNQGMDPEHAVLIGGGGAAGLNSVMIARNLGCRKLIFPETGAALSAAGALMSDLATSFRVPFVASTRDADKAAIRDVIDDLIARCDAFAQANASSAISRSIELTFEGHYPSQIWDIEVPFDLDEFDRQEVTSLEGLFHAVHERLFAIADETSPVEITGFRARTACRLREGEPGRIAASSMGAGKNADRTCYFEPLGFVSTPVFSFHDMQVEEAIEGPAILETPLTTIVINPGSAAYRSRSGSVVVDIFRT